LSIAVAVSALADVGGAGMPWLPDSTRPAMAGGVRGPLPRCRRKRGESPAPRWDTGGRAAGQVRLHCPPGCPARTAEPSAFGKKTFARGR